MCCVISITQHNLREVWQNQHKLYGYTRKTFKVFRDNNFLLLWANRYARLLGAPLNFYFISIFYARRAAFSKKPHNLNKLTSPR